MSTSRLIKRALLSVSDKAGIVEFAKRLHDFDIDILSTGGTANLLRGHNLPVTDVSDYTHFPEIMDGRVKTLHPKIHGAILGRRGQDDTTMQEHQMTPIDLVVVNLYPFQKTVSKPDCDLPTAIENIDIGGPALIRAAAKNYKDVTIIVDPNDYMPILTEICECNGATTLETRFSLAQKAFTHTSYYDTCISHYLNRLKGPFFPKNYSVGYLKKQDLRYGENPHQKAAFYMEENNEEPCIARAQQLQGKALSFNNIADTDVALECVKSFKEPACVIVKHANPCGVAIDKSLNSAYQKAFTTDPTSAFGGIIAFNRRLDAKTAKAIIEQQFVEVIIAPDIDRAAFAVMENKKNIRVLSTGQWTKSVTNRLDYKRVSGGLLVQDADNIELKSDNLRTMTQRKPTEKEQEDLLFAWKVAKFVKSNAIVYARDQTTLGIGAGQMSRIDSVKIAILKANEAGLSLKSAVMASDAFFPFRDSIDIAAKQGITAIIQPGGSIRDEEVIQAANEANMAMIFTGIRHFKH